MGEWTTLTAADGHSLAAWRSGWPEPVAGLVVVQEIFGVNEHIRAVADRYAAMGLAAIAPALFDRAEQGVELGYADADIARGRELRGKFSWDLSVLDIQAAANAVRGAGKVGIVGYCWGGSLAWLAACRGGVDAAACYYGAQIIDYNGESPRCPALLVFGDEDGSIPPETITAIRAAHPGVAVEIHPGPHGFACDRRAAYRPDSAWAAFARTFDFFAQNLR